MAQAKLISEVRIATQEVAIYFDIAVDGYRYDVKGELNVLTHEFTPHLISIFGVEQFAKEVAKTSIDEFVASLQTIVKKSLKA